MGFNSGFKGLNTFSFYGPRYQVDKHVLIWTFIRCSATAILEVGSTWPTLNKQMIRLHSGLV